MIQTTHYKKRPIVVIQETENYYLVYFADDFERKMFSICKTNQEII